MAVVSVSAGHVRAALFAMFALAAAGPARAASEHVVYSMRGGSDGAYPYASLIDVDGTLYGTTNTGGGSSACPGVPVSGCGTVFSVTPTGAEKVLHAFKGGADGSGPYASLTNVDGILYGTTESGGAHLNGTVFRVTRAGEETVVYSFKGAGDGAVPASGLLNVDGVLYGTTYYGGAHGYGTVFKITASGAETILHSFESGNDGANPNAVLVYLGGKIYGTTPYGGAAGDTGTASGNGTLFTLAPDGTEAVIHSFAGGKADGAIPSGLIDINGVLYGTTILGGESGEGVIFKTTTAGTESVLYSFKGGSDGGGPSAPAFLSGSIFGTTTSGGSKKCSYGCGTVFQVTTGGIYTLLYSFGYDCCGVYPRAGLTAVGSSLFGTTSEGGPGTCRDGCGTVFAITP